LKMEDGAWICRIEVARLTSESGPQKSASDARGRAAQNWLSEHVGGRCHTEKGASSVFDDSDEENGRPAPALAGSATEPVPPPVDIRNLVGSKVFDYESDETGSGKAAKIKTKMKNRTRPLQKEAKRRQWRRLAKMKERIQDLVYTSEEEEDGVSQKKQATSKAGKTGGAGTKKAAALDMSQRRMDGFLTRYSGNRAIDILVSQLLEMPEEPTPRVEMDEEDLLQEERLRVLDAKLER